jgi:histone deacetylase complex regulatory component SIN3
MGRPTAIPQAPIQPLTSESCFFDRVKAHFLRRDLFPDKPIVNRRQTPYQEFVKCLHLFGAGILNKDELIQLLRGLFIQGNTPKSGANAQSNTGNTAATHAAMGLLAEFEKILVGRGPFANQEQGKKFRGKYGSYPIREYDLSDAPGGGEAAKLTPSYQKYPSDFVFDKFSGASEGDGAALNYNCFCLAQDYSTDNKGEKYYKSPEDYDGIKIRRNVYEEVLARVEDEMHEVDMAIERNASVMRVLEPVAEEATRLREQEEKDGQPIGRLQYKLRNRALNSIHIGAIARVYGESGEEVLQHLMNNPLVVVPIINKRLKEKNDEWRKVKTELKKEWKKTISENYRGSLDVKCFVYQREIEQSFTDEKLLEECHKAKSFAKHPSKIQRHPATNMILPDFHLMDPDSELALFEPHLAVLASKDMPHKLAYDLLDASFSSESKKTLFNEMWVDFIAPWFGLPLSWDESEASAEKAAPTNVFTPGQKVKTAVGEGQVVSVDKTAGAFRYLIKFPFGVGFVKASAVLHLIPTGSASEEMDTSADTVDASQLMQDDIQVLFGTESIYLLMRLYILLATMLYQAKFIVDRKGCPSIMSSLQDLIGGKVSAKDFEAKCRKVVGKEVYNFVAIPPLVESCAEAIVKVAKEGCIENLYNCSQLKLKDLNQLRNLSLDVTEEAVYRLQIQSSSSQVFFSHVPIEAELQLTNPLEAKPSEPSTQPQPEPAAADNSNPPVPETNKRPLETEEPKASAEQPEGPKETAAVEPEQKKMKIEEGKAEEK